LYGLANLFTQGRIKRIEKYYWQIKKTITFALMVSRRGFFKLPRELRGNRVRILNSSRCCMLPVFVYRIDIVHCLFSNGWEGVNQAISQKTCHPNKAFGEKAMIYSKRFVCRLPQHLNVCGFYC
jgi:hypothetical protein